MIRAACRSHIRALAVIIVVALAGAGACSEPTAVEAETDPRPPNNKVLVIAVDGADREILDRLLADGELPGFRRLLERGVMANMKTFDVDPDGRLSASFWTTMATGQLSAKHGIQHFVFEHDGKKTPYTSNMRREPAFWNILSEYGATVGIVGWLVTWPAEKVNGFLVSAYYARAAKQLTWKGAVYADIPEMVFPPELEERVDGMIHTAESNYGARLEQLVALPAVSRSEQEEFKMVHEVKWIVLADEINREVGLALFASERPDLFAVYFGGIDVIGHRFTHEDRNAEREFLEQYGPVHDNYYRYIDEVLGRFLEIADESTRVVVLSDHGLSEGHHNDRGIFIAAGPGIRSNVRIEETITLPDVCPTLLYLAEVPLGQDMDGGLFDAIFEPELLRDRPPQFVSSHRSGEMKKVEPRTTRFDDKIVDRLRALGYVQ